MHQSKKAVDQGWVPRLQDQVRADWQTPVAAAILGGHICRGGKRKGELLLAGQVKMDWTTPQAHDSQGTPDAKRVGRYGTKHGGRNLPDDVAAWPTPTNRDDRSIHASPETHDRNARPLSEVAGRVAQGNPSMNGKPRGCLNSRWVASLMGYPSDWCDVPTETP